MWVYVQVRDGRRYGKFEDKGFDGLNGCVKKDFIGYGREEKEQLGKVLVEGFWFEIDGGKDGIGGERGDLKRGG